MFEKVEMNVRGKVRGCRGCRSYTDYCISYHNYGLSVSLKLMQWVVCLVCRLYV